jgi:hypothetical protein
MVWEGSEADHPPLLVSSLLRMSRSHFTSASRLAVVALIHTHYG